MGQKWHIVSHNQIPTELKLKKLGFCNEWFAVVSYLAEFSLNKPTCVCKKHFNWIQTLNNYMGRFKRIWYLSPMRAAKVQGSLCICAVSPEPSLLAHTSSELRGTFRQKARSQAPLNGWACAVKICHDGMREDTNSLDGAHILSSGIWMHFNISIGQFLYISDYKNLSWVWGEGHCFASQSCAEWSQTVILRDRFFCPHRTTMIDSFSCIPFDLQRLI